MRRRCAVLGSPITHSLSPALHLAAYEVLGLDWAYDAYDVDESGLRAFLGGLGAVWRGLSLTMPLKQAAIGVCSRVDDRAGAVGAVNTLVLEPGGETMGLNTDVPGFVASWQEAGLDRVTGGHRPSCTAMVLGAGATARSAVAALAELGMREIVLAVRSPERALPVIELAEEMGLVASLHGLAEEWPVPEVDLLVSTVPAGVLEALPARLVERLVEQAAAVSDVVYVPADTLLLRTARAYARPVSTGFDLLLHQAARQVELMTGCLEAPLDAMREAGRSELARREGHP